MDMLYDMARDKSRVSGESETLNNTRAHARQPASRAHEHITGIKGPKPFDYSTTSESWNRSSAWIKSVHSRTDHVKPIVPTTVMMKCIGVPVIGNTSSENHKTKDRVRNTTEDTRLQKNIVLRMMKPPKRRGPKPP